MRMTDKVGCQLNDTSSYWPVFRSPYEYEITSGTRASIVDCSFELEFLGSYGEIQRIRFTAFAGYYD
jgi:hypothetical protein